jgi:hypothetical protein
MIKPAWDLACYGGFVSQGVEVRGCELSTIASITRSLLVAAGWCELTACASVHRATSSRILHVGSSGVVLFCQLFTIRRLSLPGPARLLGPFSWSGDHLDSRPLAGSCLSTSSLFETGGFWSSRARVAQDLGPCAA